METREQYEAQIVKGLEDAGEQRVRLTLASGGYPENLRLLITRWLTQKDRDRIAGERAAQQQRADSERYAKIRDDIAAIAAVIAAIAAIVGAFISYFAWLHPRAPS